VIARKKPGRTKHGPYKPCASEVPDKAALDDGNLDPHKQSIVIVLIVLFFVGLYTRGTSPCDFWTPYIYVWLLVGISH
jgi:hypothetical protein